MSVVSKVHVYAEGIVCMSVCAPKEMPIAEVLEDVNFASPTGLAHGWKLSGDSHFKGGEPNPCPCDKLPDERVHYLLNC